jgi:HK97 family phage prohead protease
MLRKVEAPFQIKGLSDDGTFSGYGSIFGNVDYHGEVVVEGAFKNSLAEWRKKGKLPPVIWQHDKTQPLGPHTEMREDAKGLYLEGRLLKDTVPKAAEAYSLLKEDVISGLSIGFRVKLDEWDRESGVTYLKELDLWEVSLVTFPANEQAGVTGVKADEIKSIRDYEAALRDEFGFSHAQAKALASAGFKALQKQDEPRDVVAALESLNARIRAAIP